MKKLKLKLDEIKVDSFQINPSIENKGTAVGNILTRVDIGIGGGTCGGDTNNTCFPTQCGDTCAPTCGITCGTCETCNYTCGGTCDISCGGTCDITCIGC